MKAFIFDRVDMGEWPAELRIKDIEGYPGVMAEIYLRSWGGKDEEKQLIQLRKKNEYVALFAFQYFDGPEYMEGWWKDAEVIWEMKNF